MTLRPCTRRAAIVLLALLAAACGNRKETSEPPAELVSFEPSLDIEELWSNRVGRGSERLRLGLRPASDGVRVYAGANNGTAAAFDVESGDEVWSVDTELALAAGPGLANGILAFGSSDGVLLALDAETGNELWRVAVGSEILAPPAVGPNVVVIRVVDGTLRAHSAQDGAQIWSIRQTLPSLVLRGNTAPRIAGAIVVAGFDNGRVGAYDLGTGDALWEVPVGLPSGRGELERLVDVGAAGLEIVGNRVFAVGYHGNAISIDLNTGIQLWQQELSSYAGLGADFGTVYVTTDVDAVVAIARDSGAQRWRQEALRRRDVTAPTRHGPAVVVGDFEGYLHWLDAQSGEFLARVRATSGRVNAAPLVVGDAVIAQGEDGTLAAFAIVEEAPEQAESDDAARGAGREDEADAADDAGAEDAGAAEAEDAEDS